VKNEVRAAPKDSAPAAPKYSAPAAPKDSIKAPVSEPKPSKQPLKKPTFSWEKNYAPKKALEPPAPTSQAAQNKVPNPYKYDTEKAHPLITKARTLGTKGFNLDWSQAKNLYPVGNGHFVRGRDSLRTYLTQLFTTEIALYDGAMGTMIQKHKLEEEDYRGERFKDCESCSRATTTCCR